MLVWLRDSGHGNEKRLRLWTAACQARAGWCLTTGQGRLVVGVPDEVWAEARAAELAAQAALLRDLFGPLPFRPVSVAASWRTPAVVGLARAIEQEQDYGLMPVLADALMDADCSDPDLLDHLRGPEPHLRGCWLLDLLLDKS
jgi:hypothetical protein